MEKDISQGNIGTVGKYDVLYKDGKVTASASVQDGPASIELTIGLDAKSVAVAGLEHLKTVVKNPLLIAAIASIEEEVKALA